MNTRKIKVQKSRPKTRSIKPGSWRELLFVRMGKPGSYAVAKLSKNDKAAIYATIHQAKASGCFKMKTLDDGRTEIERVK